MISSALAFLIGVLTLLQFSSLPNVQLLWLSPLAVGVILLGHHDWVKTKTMAACLCGFLWALFIAHLIMSKGLPAELEGEDVLVIGTIENFPQQQNRATRFLFMVDEMHFNGRVYPSPGRIRLSWYDATELPKIGEQWQFLVRLKPPHGFMNPGGLDYETLLFSHRIRATGYVRQQITPQRQATASGTKRWQQWRFYLYEQINQATADSYVPGVLNALAIGERDGIASSQWDVLRRTGTAHLMAISGLHIGLLAGLGYALGFWFWRLRSIWLKRWPAQKFAALTSIVFAFIYAAMAGFSIPTQRALIMVCVLMLAILRQRGIQPLQVLAQSLLLVLLLDPLSALSAGFWLSFTAVTVILYGLHGRMNSASKWQSLFRMQWIVVLGLLPLTIGLFQQASVISPICNLLAIPVVSFIVVPLTLLACVIMFFSLPVANIVLLLANNVMEVLWRFLEYVAEFSLSQIQLAASSTALVLMAIGIALLLSPKGIPQRYLGLVFCLPLLFPVINRPEQGKMWLSLLDVGQGLAVVVQTRQHTLVYDTGPKFSDSFDTGEAVIAPFLRLAGVNTIDMLMVTHGDNDHIGGAASLQKMFTITDTLSSIPQRLSHRARRCQQGQQWLWDGVRFTVLHPTKQYVPERRAGNNLSCVLRVESDNGSVLLTGDIEKEAEQQLLALQATTDTTLNSDVLVVPHHGSRTSSSQAFIVAVAPKLALIPVGYRNRYRLPNRHILDRYAMLSIPVLTTAQSGRILLTFTAPHVTRASRYRTEASRFWHHQLP